MDSEMKNLCPVCGYDLEFPAWDGNLPSGEICPCCGIQFGYDDAAGGQQQLRREIYENWRSEWVSQGMPWRSEGTRPPENWCPTAQLEMVGGQIRSERRD